MVRENGKWKGRRKQDFERPGELLLKTTLKKKVRKENIKKQGVAQDLVLYANVIWGQTVP